MQTRLRRSWRTIASSLIFCGALLVSSTVTGATYPGFSTVTFTAPFHGVSQSARNMNHAGCAVVTDTPRPFLDATRGEMGLNSSSQARSCLAHPGNSSAWTYAYGAATLRIPVGTGTDEIFINYSYKITVNLSTRAGSCVASAGSAAAACDVYAEFNTSLWAFVALGNQTWGESVPFNSTIGDIDNSSTCGAAGTCTYSNSSQLCGPTYCYSVGPSGFAPFTISGSGSWVVHLSSAIPQRRTMAHIVTQFQAWTSAATDASGGRLTNSRASVSLNEATLGNGFWIRTIAES